MDTAVLSQLPQECSFLPPGPQQHKEKLAFSSCLHSTASWFKFFFFKASFQVLCPAGSESVATKHRPWHQDSAAQQMGQGTVQSAGTQPHLCKEITVGLSASHPSFLPVQLGIIFYLMMMMWGLTCCASYGKGGPWMEGPTDEQRIIAISGCEST